MRVLLVATYELGHQPGNLAGPAGRLRDRGHEVRALDTSLDPWDPSLVDWADRVAFSVPMHTATRLARELATTITKPVCCYGLYASMCDDVADVVIAGEYEDALVAWVEGEPVGVPVQLGPARPEPRTGSGPARALLPPLDRYVRLSVGNEMRVVGSVEASRGCAHRCRHCPVPVVYDGRVRVADEAAVLADIDQLVAAGAQHITFGDPDFLNAPQHSMRIVRALHARFPDVTFDCTVKVEHVLAHQDLLAELRDSGCLFMVSAFESLNDETLDRLDKGHTAADAAHAVTLLRTHGIDVRPSFLPFTPWTTRADIVDLLEFAYAHDLVGSIDPVQYTIRLLLPEGSLLLDHPDLAPFVGPWDPARLTYEWTPADPRMDALQRELLDAGRGERGARRDHHRDLCAAPRRSRTSSGRSLEHDHRSPAADRELVLLRGTHRHATEGSHPMTEELTNYNQQMIEQFRANGGKMDAGAAMSMLLLTTTGAKSGRTYLNPLAAFEEDGRLFVIASKARRAAESRTGTTTWSPTRPSPWNTTVRSSTPPRGCSPTRNATRSSRASSSRPRSSVSTRRRPAARSRSWSSSARAQPV